MTPDAIKAKIYKAYAKAASKLGPAYQFYRPAQTDLTTLSGPGTATVSLPVSLNAEDMTYSRPNKYGKATWFALFDGTQAQVGDYFVGTEGTFFVATMQALLPILAVECNRTVTVSRAPSTAGIGAQSYGGSTPATEVTLMRGWPASILQGTKGEKDPVGLPLDVREPWWIVLLPHLAGVTLRSSDIITDDLGRRYSISSAELTDPGWRLTAQQAAA